MRGLWLFLGACLIFGPALARTAQAPFPIVDVVEKGLPPFRPGDRIYLLDGGREQGLRPGVRLAVRRTGDPRLLGWLQVTEVGATQSEARLEREGPTYLLKGDLAWRKDLEALPVVPRFDEERLAVPPIPERGTEAPPREGLLFFLPQRDDLSPAGLRKLVEWVAAWGAGGRWAVQVPAAKGLSPELQHRRAETLRTALQAQGVTRVEVDEAPRHDEGKYDPAWVRHWDG